MKTSRKLSTLMQIFRLSNVELARGVGVDPSLVSRWKSGERTPGGGQISGIAGFLAGMRLTERDRAALEDAVGAKCFEPGETEPAIFDWLSAGENGDGSLAEKTFDYANRRIAGRKAEPTGPVNLWPHVMKGFSAEHEVFYDDKGRRQAALNFLHALQPSRPTDIFIRLWKDTGWIERDGQFARLWEKGLKKLEEAGHCLTVAADFGHGAGQYEESLFSGGTLYSSAGSPSMTLMVARGVCAVMSDHDGQTTLFFKNMRDTALFESLFRLMLPNGPPLLRTFGAEDDISRQMAELERSPGEMLCRIRSPREIFLSDHTALSAAAPRSEDEAGRLSDELRRRRSSFFAKAGREGWMDALPAELFDAVCLNGSCVLSGGLMNGAFIEGEALRELFAGMLDAMRRIPRYRVLWEEVPEDGAELAMCREGAALFYKIGGNGSRSGFLLGDAARLSALREWFDSRETTKDESMSRLKFLISHL